MLVGLLTCLDIYMNFRLTSLLCRTVKYTGFIFLFYLMLFSEARHQGVGCNDLEGPCMLMLCSLGSYSKCWLIASVSSSSLPAP